MPNPYRLMMPAFDVVISRYSAHHWHDVGQALREVKRVLKPGGIFIIMDVMSPGIRCAISGCRRWKRCAIPRMCKTTPAESGYRLSLKRGW
jgi:ubiquinone/menaquinone biosynthesis C-methylase UbiE